MRGKPFQLGNRMGKGRPPGRRNKRTIFQETLGIHGVEIVNQAKLLALRPNPDRTALRLCFEGLVAKPKPPNSSFPLPRIRTPADLPNALSAVERAVASGRLSAQEGLAMVQMIEGHQRSFETVEFDQRIRAIEEDAPKTALAPTPIPGKPTEPIDPSAEKGGEDQ